MDSARLKIWKAYKEEYKSLFRLGLPVLVTQLGVIVVSFADTMMVGAYGVDELAAAAFVNSLFVIFIVMQIGFAQGLTPLIGALFGKGEKRAAGETMRAGLQINSILSLSLTLLMGVVYFYLDRFGQPDEIMPIARQYYLIVLSTLFPLAIFNVLQQTCNAVNDTASPMWVMLGCNVVNIIGNWLLIYGNLGAPELGLTGAGLSTMVARWAGSVTLLLIFFRRRRYAEYCEGYRMAKGLGQLRRKVWVTSYPVMIQSGIECMLWSLGAVVSGWFGKIQLAAYQVINTMSQLGFMTYISVGTAISIRVANYTGARNHTGVRRITAAGFHLNMVLATVASLIFIIGGRHLLHVFTPDADVIASGLTLLIPMVVYQYMDSTQISYCNAIRGTSEVKPLLWIALLCYIGIGVPVMMLFARYLNMGNVGVYYSFNVALAASSLISTLIFYRILKRQSRLAE